MQRLGFLSSIIFASGLALGLAALAGNLNLPGQDTLANTWFQPRAATHETRSDSLQFPNASEVVAKIESVSSVPATRGSFMASWNNTSDAVGYLLDVSTSSSFSSYVEGYQNLDVGNVTGRVVTGLNRGTTYYYRVRAYNASGAGAYSELVSVTTVATAGLIINPTFDSSILNNANAAAIEAMINRAIAIYESLFRDPITIEILFRYATTAPDGTTLPQGTLSQSLTAAYAAPWGVYINELRADAKTSNDNLAIASLPASALSANISATSANSRALGGNAPPTMFANGTIGPGGPYDGIVTLNSAMPFQFTRPPSASNLDAQRLTEHEMDSVMGLVSYLGQGGTNLFPEDLFSWSSPGVRNTTTNGIRYFSIDGGVTGIVYFNQDQSLNLGDWLGAPCPQPQPYVQNAFSCVGQSSDIAATSPEGIDLDVMGYDLVVAPRAAVADFNNDGHPDYVLRNPGTRQTAIWYLNNNVYQSGALGPSIAAGWGLDGVADFNRDSHPDYALFNSTTDQTAFWYLSGPTFIASAYGPTLPGGWELVATGDFNGDGKPDYVLYDASTHQTAIWYLNNNVYVGGGYGPTIPAGWSLVGVADFNRDGHRDYLLFNSANQQSAIWYLSGLSLVGATYGPTIPSGWALVATADFNGDGRADYLLYNLATRQTAIWYLNNNVYVSGAYGPTLPAGWSF